MVGYEAITKFVKSLYFIRDKKLNEEFLPIWIREISIRQPDITILNQIQSKVINDETIPLNVSSICKQIESIKKELTIKALSYDSKKCPFCHGTGIASITAKFSKEGKLINTNTALKCCCSQSKQDFLQMNHDPQTNNRTETDNGYSLVFETVGQRDKYLAETKRQKSA